MFIRVYVNVNIYLYSEGCKNHFSNCLNIMDIVLILLNITSIALYIAYHNLLQEIEDVTLAFLIILRNGSQLLRLIVLIKNQKTVKVNNLIYVFLSPKNQKFYNK